MPNTEEEYKKAMKGKDIPILSLDNKWHQLFTQTESTPKIERLEAQLNKLIKRQGKLNTETKEIRTLKKKLMSEIVNAVDELGMGVEEKKNNKKIDANKRLVVECGEKLDAYKKELTELPKQIEEVNRQLMIATMEVCYKRIRENTNDIEEITQWMNKVRVELKKKAVRKEEKEDANKKLYAYMHDIFGAEVLEIFDMKYNPMEETKANEPKKQ